MLQERIRTNKDAPYIGLSCFLISQPTFVSFEASEPNRHFRDYPRENSTKTFVKSQGCLSLNDICSGSKETSRFSLNLEISNSQ